MQIAILPSHHDLDDSVQLLEGVAIRHLDAPYVRLDVIE